MANGNITIKRIPTPPKTQIFKGAMYFITHLLITIGVVLVVVNKTGCI